MRHSEFHAALAEVFGDGYATSVARDIALDALDSRTAVEALADGEEPRDVWHALCDQMDVPDVRRSGVTPQVVARHRR